MAKRFIRRGKTRILFSPTLANPLTGATRTELTSALNLTPEVADLSGWSLENSPAATPDMASTFEKSIPGTDAAADSTLTLYEDELSEITELALAKNTVGYIILLRKGDRPGSKSMDTFAVRVASKGPEFNAGNEPARYVLTFSIEEEPSLDKAVPAAAA